jgi:hypothetical protein
MYIIENIQFLKEENPVICNNMDKIEGHYGE